LIAFFNPTENPPEDLCVHVSVLFPYLPDLCRSPPHLVKLYDAVISRLLKVFSQFCLLFVTS
jgi:hypothetical protein